MQIRYQNKNFKAERPVLGRHRDGGAGVVFLASGGFELPGRHRQ